MTSSVIFLGAPVEAARAWFGTVQVVERLQRYLKRQRLSDKKTHAHNYFVEELLGFAHRNPPSYPIPPDYLYGAVLWESPLPVLADSRRRQESRSHCRRLEMIMRVTPAPAPA